MRQLKVGSWVGAGHQRDQAGVKSSDPPRKGKGLESKLIINHIYKASIKILELWYSENFQDGEHVQEPGGRCVTYLQSTETEAPMLRALLDLTLCLPSSGYSFVSFEIAFVISRQE